ncbi:MAG: dephospho-CoA kinase [Planctomycetota bacterium]
MTKATQPLVIGLLGGVGSGKSTVARLFHAMGAEVFEADRVASDLLEDGEVRARLTAAFGKDILAADGQVDRARLAQLVFTSAPARETVNAIIHPRVIAELTRWLAARTAPAALRPLVLDVPLLLETPLRDLPQVMVFVDAPEAARRARVMQDRGWSTGELERRERAQASLEDKRGRADHVLHNDGSLVDLERQVRALWRTLLARGEDAGRDGGSGEPQSSGDCSDDR